LEALLRDSAWLFVDDTRTTEKEDLASAVTTALKKASVELSKNEEEGKLSWGAYKNTTIYHLLRTNAMPFARTGLNNGGGVNILNATTHSHGPSWRMVVHLNTETEAYAVYPGGQSGNPGSRFYDNFVDKWTKGEYYKVWVMKASEQSDKRIKWKMTFKS
jgi:penicillin amidase